MLLEPEDALTQPHLFTLRIWVVNAETPAFEWRGRIQNLHSGEVNYCTDWDSLVAYLEETLHEQGGKSAAGV